MTTNMAGETVEGKGNECIFRNHGITLRSKTDVLDGVRITSRCLRYEQNDFGLSDSENLCSKLYLLRVENCDIMLKVRVKLPIFQGASECEELVMKTDRGKEVKVTKTKRSKRKGWFATFRCKLNKEITFVIVCRALDEKPQHLEYGQANDDINSCLDTARADDATDSCLDTARAHDVTDSCQDTSRSSSRSLYSRVTHEEYDVMFLVMSKLSENDIEAFELIVDCSGVFKAAMNKIFWEKKGFQRELQSVVCKSLAKQTFNISLPTIDKEGTIEDCTKASIALQFHPLRPNFIKHKLYCERSKLKQLLSQIEIAKQSPPINELSDVVTEKVSPSVILLTVFKESEPSNKDNIQRKVLLTDQLKSEITGDKLTPSREYENNEHDLLPENKLDVKGEICNHGNEDLRLPLDELQSETEVEFTEPIEHRETVEVKDEPTKDWIQRECLNDQLLTCLQDKFCDSWIDILLLLGIPFNVIVKELVALRDNRTLDDIKLKLLQQWRDRNSDQSDKGIPQLLSAFQKCGKIDCSHFLRLAIKDWRTQTAVHGDPLYLWLEQAYADPDMFTPTNYPRPMSDQYLTLLITGVTPSAELASQLGISEGGYNRIAENPSYPDDKTKIMKLLTLFREKANSTESALSGLLDAFNALEYSEQRSRGIACASGWLNRHAEERDELRTSVKKVLENAIKDQPKPKTFERKWALVKHKISSGLQFSRQKSIQASRVTDPSTSARSQVHQGFFG